MKILKNVAIAVTVAIVLVAALLAPIPIPPDRVLSEVVSPDSLLIAQFSWRPLGVVGAITKDNPWVYVTIRRRGSNAVVERYRAWGDVPDDAYSLLGKHVPWMTAVEERRTTTDRQVGR
jgi:hypothetical protein